MSREQIIQAVKSQTSLTGEQVYNYKLIHCYEIEPTPKLTFSLSHKTELIK